jgi:hypothetical protein
MATAWTSQRPSITRSTCLRPKPVVGPVPPPATRTFNQVWNPMALKRAIGLQTRKLLLCLGLPQFVQVLKVATMATSVGELLGNVGAPILRSVIVAMIASKIPQLLRDSRVPNSKAATIVAGIWGLFRDVAVPILTSRRV